LLETILHVFVGHRLDQRRGEAHNIPAMPIVEHAPDRGGVVEVAEAVLSQLVKVHEDRDEHDPGQGRPPPER